MIPSKYLSLDELKLSPMERKKILNKKYQQRNSERIREYNRLWARQWREKNHERSNSIALKWYRNHREKAREVARKCYAKNREKYVEALRKRRFIYTENYNRLKMKPCVDCGIQYNPWVMDFDHRNPKEKSFSMSLTSWNMDRLLEEGKKCDVVCANCHRERTHKQRLAGAFR